MPVLELNLPHCCTGDLNFCCVIQGSGGWNVWLFHFSCVTLHGP